MGSGWGNTVAGGSTGMARIPHRRLQVCISELALFFFISIAQSI
jgi:hypothetical protein